jgi:hypothetical protein
MGSSQATAPMIPIGHWCDIGGDYPLGLDPERRVGDEGGFRAGFRARSILKLPSFGQYGAYCGIVALRGELFRQLGF